MNPRMDEVRTAVRKVFPLANWGGRGAKTVGWGLTLRMVGQSVAVTLDHEKRTDHLTFAVGPDDDPVEVVARQVAKRKQKAAIA